MPARKKSMPAPKRAMRKPTTGGRAVRRSSGPRRGSNLGSVRNRKPARRPGNVR